MRNNEEKKEQYEIDTSYSKGIDPVTLEELNNALKSIKSRKVSGLDKIKTELIKHTGLLFKLRLLHLLNKCDNYRGYKPNEQWI